MEVSCSNGKKNIFLFKSVLLIPCVQRCKDLNFVWEGTLNTHDNTIDVLTFKTERKEHIVALLEEDLKVLRTEQQVDNVQRQIAFIEGLLDKLSDEAFYKTPNQTLLDTVARRLEVPVASDNVIYLSGVSAIL